MEAFRALDLAGMARVDFFLDGKGGGLYLNEVNTIPGFTTISMYPKMWAESGLPYPALLDRLIRSRSSATGKSRCFAPASGERQPSPVDV